MSDELCSYVHYFSVWDIYARGSLRAFCFTYVTKSTQKAMKHFASLRDELAGICDTLKLGNNTEFLADLRRHELDLLFTQTCLIAQQERETTAVIPVTQTEAPDKADAQASRGRNGPSARAGPAQNEQHQYLNHMNQSEQHQYLSHMNRAERSALLVSVEQALIDTRTMRNEVAGGTGAEGSFSKVLEKDTNRKVPSPSLGCEQIKQIWETPNCYGRERSSTTAQRQMQASSRDVDGRNRSGSLGPHEQQRRGATAVPYAPKFLRSAKMQRSLGGHKLRALSELTGSCYTNAMARLRGVLNRFSRNSRAHAMEEMQSMLLRRPILPGLLTIGGRAVVNFFVDGSKGTAGSAEAMSSTKDTKSSSNAELNFIGHSVAISDAGDSSISSMGTARGRSFSTARTHLTSDSVSHGTSPSPGHRRRHNMFDVRSPFRSPFETNSAADRMQCGEGLLAAIKSYSFLLHVIYALLRGRPMVILASASAEIKARDLVATLSFFVPGTGTVVPWESRESLQLTDLSRIKLIALSKQLAIPAAVERFSSFLDIDTGVLRSPVYDGILLEGLLLQKPEWISERVLLTHVVSEFHAIATKALLLYHQFAGQDDSASLLEGEVAGENDVDAFLFEIGVTGCDRHIVCYLAEVVKLQLTEDARQASQAADTSAPSNPPFQSVTLDFSVCSTMQHVSRQRGKTASKPKPKQLPATRSLTSAHLNKQS